MEIAEQELDATASAPLNPEARIPAFDWRNCWYPVAFTQDLARDRPTSFSIYDEAMVLFCDEGNRLHCLEDRCPHRGARLSDGQIRDGRLECLYHGRQFGPDGKCLHIPQLASELPIPARAGVRAYPLVEKHGMVWVWAGEADKSDPDLIPTVGCFDDKSLAVVDFQMDLPYDQGYLIENVIDVAHIHIAHDGMRGGGLRSAAKPLHFDVLESSRIGIRCTFRTMGLVAGDGTSPLKAAVVEFIAPNLIRYTSDYRNSDLVAGLSLYSLPLGKGRCRLLYRKYSNFTLWSETLKPRWLEHWIQCTILEQDMAVVIGQYEHTERSRRELKDLWQPLKTSDLLVVEYRKWLDKFGQDLPSYRGYATHKSLAADAFTFRTPTDRFNLHTKICGTCTRTYRNVGRLTQGLWILVAALGAIGTFSDSLPRTRLCVGVAVASLLAIFGLNRVKRRFR